MKYALKNTVQKGFSLVEMLIVIAVIGIIAAIAIPNISNVNAAATAAKDQQNAQSIVSVYQAGAAAGVVWTTDGTAATAIASVIAGASPATGPFAGDMFTVPNITGTDLTGASQYISWSPTFAGLEYSTTPVVVTP